MPRRVSLPGADELFGERQRAARSAVDDRAPEPAAAVNGVEGAVSQPSGRIRHEEKITIYVTADELLDLEQTRLELRRTHGVAVDRGRIVREAIHLTLEDVASRGDQSDLVRRLRAG